MRLSFPVASTPHPVGGVAISYEFAEHLARRGHEVTILHHENFGDDAVTSIAEVGWYRFDPLVQHHFIEGSSPDVGLLPDADIFVGHAPDVDLNPRLGLPVKLIQGWKMYPHDQEVAAFRTKAPKACVAKWLVRVGRELGVPDHELVHTPIALHHEQFRVSNPLADRAPHIVFCWNPHPMKGAARAVEVLAQVHEARPDVRISAFGHTAQPDAPAWMEFHVNPTSDRLVDELYNSASIFLCASRVEGFGLTNLEAMACGAALVTTDCGGIEDYAIHDETALVSDVTDSGALRDNVLAVLDDPALQARLATAGNELAATFTWERSASIMESFFTAYLADPSAYGRG